MKKLKWYFKNGTKYEEYNVLYDDGKFMLVQNNNNKKYSFGLKNDFGTLYGFPVNQSCLTLTEVNTILKDFIDIDMSYVGTLGQIANDNIIRWNNMMLSIN